MSAEAKPLLGSRVPSRSPSVDWVAADGKRLPYSGFSVFFYFLFCLLAVLPFWLVVLLPLTIICQLLKLPLRLFSSRAKSSSPEISVESLARFSGSVPYASRKYDLVLFGATGFTGELAARYLASGYKDRFKGKFALAGRRRDALLDIQRQLIAVHPDAGEFDILVADVNDLPSLHAVVSNTRVVITTVGPYARYGTPLVALCATLGTHYCDITGEADWVRQMIDKYDDAARASGARIVHFCGHDCIPWDLLTQSVASHFQSSNQQLASVTMYDEIRASASGGTIETILESLKDRVPYKSKIPFDPMDKMTSGERSSCKVVNANRKFLGRSRGFWVGPFLMAAVNVNCVRRSNAMLGYGPQLVYEEAVVYPSFFAGFVTNIGLLILGTSFFCPPLLWVLQKFVLPAPGQGPSKASMEAGFLQVTAHATGTKGGRVRAKIYFPVDPGYRDTARMLVEAGMTHLQTDEINSYCPQGGVYTPAVGLGPLLLQRLRSSGTEIAIIPAE
eukprot:gnl/Spiro4/24506_TR12145_c0_g1_i1.p1 gnl/Spiro4/24506_TR12145_c0_g1~~gnl/Spiro4/24506_TR12145_c0_g1_i1.p1  ORF type:complete len:504 (-),score=88.61 gnl/Spiro4/24506_TR12145_c0_g1_i1:118-1629(-)